MVTNIVVIAIQVGILILLVSLASKIVDIVFKLVGTYILRNNKRCISHYHRRIGLFILISGACSCLALIIVNGYIFYQGKDVLTFQLSILRTVPQAFWISTGFALLKCLMLALIVKLLQPTIFNIIKKIKLTAKNLDKIQGNDQSIDRFFDFLGKVVSTGIWLGAAVLYTRFLRLPVVVTNVFYWILTTFLTIGFGLLVVRATPILVDTLDELVLQYKDTDNPLRFYEKFRHLIPLCKRCLELTVYVTTVSIIAQYTQFVSWLPDYTYKAIGLIGLYFFSHLLIELANVVIDEFTRRSYGLTETQKQRRLTIAPLLKNASKYFIYFGALISSLNILEIDPTPILAGAGILGIAIGFGVKSLVEDIVSGFLILFENYYLVGDYIQAGRIEERPIEGFVEAIELRTTQVRHPDGQLQLIRNGEIGSVVNYSKQYIYAMVNIPLAYKTDLDSTYATLEKVGHQLHADYSDIVLEPTQIDGIESLEKSLILIRTITKVKPGKHLYIQRLLRKKLKDAFDQLNIELSNYEPETNPAE